MFKSVSNPGDHCFLVPRLISGLTGRAREHLEMDDNLDRFAVDGGPETFLEYLETKMGVPRPQEEGMAFKKCIYEIKRARGESMTSWINRPDEALMDMRKKLATAQISSASTVIPPQIQGWLLLHRARLRVQDIVGVMTMTGGSLNIKLAEKSLLDLFTDDVLQSVDRSHGNDSGNTRKRWSKLDSAPTTTGHEEPDHVGGALAALSAAVPRTCDDVSWSCARSRAASAGGVRVRGVGDSSAASSSLTFQLASRVCHGAVLQPPKSADVESICKWEQRLKQYEEQSADVVSDTIKTRQDSPTYDDARKRCGRPPPR